MLRPYDTSTQTKREFKMMPNAAPPNNTTKAVQLENLSVSFTSGSSTVKAVDGVNLEIAEGEFFSLLGPSGSGKTTCLRLIGGFEKPSAGRVVIFGTDASSLPPYSRDVNTVFQDYALFPHMNIRDNVAYGLMVRNVPKSERHRESDKFLEMVKLGGFGDRKPSQLSGGQRQRVALARALINEQTANFVVGRTARRVGFEIARGNAD
jgi:putative spermidine/putrescine transport system ATP-binding protein